MANYTTNPIELHYPFLKQQGINYIRQLAGKVWTDYNEHDPGITILEELCFAIVDLEYRTNFYVEDLLESDPNDATANRLKHFYTSEEILPCNPLTKNDFLKLIVDVEGVKNAKIFLSEPPQEIQGGYKVLLDVEDRIINKGQIDQLVEKVKQTLYRHRNLCEDFFSIGLLEPRYLRVNAAIELDENLSQEACEVLIAEIFFHIQSAIAPYIKFYSLREMLVDRQKKVDEVFTGPLLAHGFVDEREIEQSTLQQEVYISEVLKKITALQHIQSVMKFTVLLDNQEDANTKMALDIPVDQVLKVDIDRSQIILYHKGMSVVVDPKNVKRWTEEIINARIFKRPYLTEEEIAVRQGRFRNLSAYTSIQNDFPLVYGIGQEGLENSATLGRKTQAKQLKGYLMFFDQLFANYLAQLAHVKDLMAVQKRDRRIAFTETPRKVPLLDTLIKRPGAPLDAKEEDIDRNFKVQRKYVGINWRKRKSVGEEKESDILETYKHYLNKILEISQSFTYKKSDILDHLLSRFAETFTNKASQIYDYLHQDCTQECSDSKELYVEDYVAISKDRNKAIDLTNKQNDGWDVDNISGFERRMCRALGIQNLTRRFLHEDFKNNFYLEPGFEQQTFELFISENLQAAYDNLFIFKGNYPRINYLAIRHGGKESNYEITEEAAAEGNYVINLYIDNQRRKSIQLINKEITLQSLEQAQSIIKQAVPFFQSFNKASEGFHLIEHIMLRASDTLQGTHDPYSFVMTLVFPDWPARFQREDFRNLVHEWVMLESPAHLFVNILWLDMVEMETFERAYKEWLFYRTTTDPNNADLKEAARHLLGVMMLYSNNQE